MRTTLLFASGVGLVVALAVAAPAAAEEHDDGLDLAATTTYTVDLDADEIDVTVRFTAENAIAPTATEFFFFPGFRELIPDAAVDLRASQNGTPLTMEATELDAEGFVVWEIDFARNLLFRQTAEVVLEYSLPTEPLRSDTITRVNDAYFSVLTLGSGDTGKSNVEIVMPSWFEAEWFGAPFMTSTEGLSKTLRVEGVDPLEFVALVTGRSDRSLEEFPVAAAGDFDESVVIAPWPGDDEWRAFAGDGVVELVPVLERLIGVPWPVEGELLVREANSGLFRGYSGVFFREDDETDDVVIEVDETLDEAVLAHELAHGWFNRSNIGEGWIYEGLSEEFARLAMQEVGGDFEPFESVARDSPAAIPLSSWRPLALLDEEQDLYGYSAASALFARLTEEIGVAAVREVISGVLAGESAYRNGGEARVVGGDIDWRRLLDGYERQGGSTAAEAEFAEWVIVGSSAGLLETRRSAIERFDELAQRSGPWGVPADVIDAITRWQFSRLTSRLDHMALVVDRRDEVAARAADLGIALTDEPREEFAGGDEASREAALAVLQAQAEGLDALQAATERHAAPRSRLTQIGLWGQDPDRDLDAARQALEDGDPEAAIAAADALVALLDDADDVGRGRVVWAASFGGAVALAGAAALWWRHRRRREPAVAAQPAEAAGRGGEANDVR